MPSTSPSIRLSAPARPVECSSSLMPGRRPTSRTIAEAATNLRQPAQLTTIRRHPGASPICFPTLDASVTAILRSCRSISIALRRQRSVRRLHEGTRASRGDVDELNGGRASVVHEVSGGTARSSDSRNRTRKAPHA